jgi:hypothetical protein
VTVESMEVVNSKLFVSVSLLCCIMVVYNYIPRPVQP